MILTTREKIEEIVQVAKDCGTLDEVMDNIKRTVTRKCGSKYTNTLIDEYGTEGLLEEYIQIKERQ